jgi:hypothetical protein
MGLIECLKNVPDPRQSRGKRHPLWLALLIIILGAMLGYWGYRPLSEFIETYGEQLRRHLKLSQEVDFPSYSTLRRIMERLDFVVWAQMFEQWAQQYVSIPVGEVLAIDGKSIASTLSDHDQATQNFLTIVSLFSHQRGFVYQMQAMENQQVSEQAIVEQMLASLELQAAVVTMDALHCQKKPSYV